MSQASRVREGGPLSGTHLSPPWKKNKKKNASKMKRDKKKEKGKLTLHSDQPKDETWSREHPEQHVTRKLKKKKKQRGTLRTFVTFKTDK